MKEHFSSGRRQHLKNLRKLQKTKRSEMTLPRARSAGSKGNPLVSIGLILCSIALLVLLGSVLFQLKNGPSANPPESGAQPLPAVDPATVEVRVLNGCGMPGASKQMTWRLRDLRFDVVSTDNAANFNYENTLVINHTSRPELGRAVAAALGCTRLSTKTDELALADVTVILGKDWEEFITDKERDRKPGGLSSLLTAKLKKALSWLGLNN